MRGTGEAQNHGCHGKTMLFAMLDTAPRRVICPTRRRHRNSELLQFLRTIKANRLAGLVCSTGRCTTRTRTGRTRRLQSEGGWHSMQSFMCISSRVVLAGPNRLRAGLQGYRVTGLPRTTVCAARTHRRAWTNARTAHRLVQSPIWIGRGWRATTVSVWASGRSNGRCAACCESARPCRLGITACPGRTGQAAGACQRRRRSISDQSRTQQQCRSLWAPDQP